MERSDIIVRLKEILQMAMGPAAKEIVDGCTEDSSLTADLGLNSVGILYVVIGIEELFSVSFDGVSFGDFNTVGDVVSYIQGKL